MYRSSCRTDLYCMMAGGLGNHISVDSKNKQMYTNCKFTIFCDVFNDEKIAVGWVSPKKEQKKTLFLIFRAYFNMYGVHSLKLQ